MQQLVMAPAEVILSETLLHVFFFFLYKQCTNKVLIFGVVFWFVKSKAINFSFKELRNGSICSFFRTYRVENHTMLEFKYKVQVVFAACRLHALQFKKIGSGKHHLVRFVQCVGKDTSRNCRTLFIINF